MLQLQKLKSKILHKRAAFFVVSALIILGGAFYPGFGKVALVKALDLSGGLSAQVAAIPTVDLNSIQLTLDTYVNGNASQPDNYIRVGIKDGTIRIKPKITLVAVSRCESSQTCNNPTPSDHLNVGYAQDQVFYNNRANDTVYGFVAGLLPKPADPTVCSQYSKSLVGTVTFMACKFPGSDFVRSGKQSGTILTLAAATASGTPEKAVAFRTDDSKDFNIPASEFSTLGITEANKRYTITVYEGINAQALLSWNGDNIIFPGGGKDIVIDTYATQADAIAANAQGRPSDVPAYGSVTSSAQATNKKSNGDPLTGLINSIIGIVLGFFQELIYAIFFWLIAPMIQALLSIHPYTDTFVAVIYPGWIVVRNISNIFFIAALIIIAMATLFRVESYQYRHLLVQLIIAALLVNFSLVIAQAVLALADTVQAQFLPANVTVIRSLAGNLMVAYRGTFTSANFFNGTFAGTIQPFFWLALSIGSFFVFLAIAAFLLIRIVMLWVLLLISPLAYAVGVLPTTAHYRQEWWSNFLKYAFFTPIMAFFLNMTAIMANASQSNPVLQQINSGLLQQNLGDSSIAAFVVSVTSNLLLLVFLFVGLMVAEKFGIMGASAINGLAKKGAAAPFKLGWGAFQRYKRDKTSAWSQENAGFLKKAAFTALNIGSVTKALKSDMEKNSERAKHEAEAAGLDIKRQIPIPGLREKGMPSELAEAKLHHIQELSKERPYSGFEELEVDKVINYEKMARSSAKYKDIFANQILQLMENRGGNAMLAKFKDEDGKPYEWSRESVNAWLAQMVKNGSLSHQMAGELNGAISKIGYDTGQIELTEGVNRAHGVHPEIFETEKNAQGLWQTKGKAEYETMQNFAIGKIDGLLANNASDESQKLQSRLVGVAPGSDQAEKITNRYKAELMGKIMGDVVHQRGGTDSYYEKFKDTLPQVDKKKFDNYASWSTSMAQRDNNIKKKKNAAAILQDSHWNSIWEEVDGVTHLQKGAITAFSDIKEDQLFQAGRGVQEKILVGIEQAISRPNITKADFRVALETNYRNSGLDPATPAHIAEIEAKANEQFRRLQALAISAREGMQKGKEFLNPPAAPGRGTP